MLKDGEESKTFSSIHFLVPVVLMNYNVLFNLLVFALDHLDFLNLFLGAVMCKVEQNPFYFLLRVSTF